jgi:hypothetical protein
MKSFPELNLCKGEKAMCTAGYPTPWTVTVEAVVDMPEVLLFSKQYEDMINNPGSYIKVIEGSLITSHMIS